MPGKERTKLKRAVLLAVPLTITLMFIFLDDSRNNICGEIAVLRSKFSESFRNRVAQQFTADRETEHLSKPDILTRTRPDILANPPTQEWIQKRLKHTKAMLGYPDTTQPAIWNCTQPRHTYYFPHINTIFTGIPKSGCSNWIELLLRAEGALDTVTVKPGASGVDKVHSEYSNKYRLDRDNNPARAARAGREGAFSFAVVRNPWVRLVSGYLDKLAGVGDEFRRFDYLAGIIAREMNKVDEVWGRTRSKYPTFDQFIRWLPDNLDREQMNDHFTPQYQTLCIPSANYDYIVPLELANLYSTDITHRINTTYQLWGSYDNTADPRTQTSVVKAKEWLTGQDPQLIARLYKIFEPDFALMNYSNFDHPDFPLPLYNPLDYNYT